MKDFLLCENREYSRNRKRITTAKIEIETILQRKSLFVSVIETKAEEPLILDKVLTVLIPHLKKKEG